MMPVVACRDYADGLDNRQVMEQPAILQYGADQSVTSGTFGWDIEFADGPVVGSGETQNHV